MTFSKKIWATGETITADLLNRIEQALSDHDVNLGDLSGLATTDKTNIINAINEIKQTPGTDGKSAFQIWVDQGNTGTVTDFLNSLIGAKGDQGLQGPAGATTLSGLTDVNITTTPSEGQLLKYISGKWTAGTDNVGSGGSGGDMIKSIYDTNDNGKVDIAESADSVDWLGVQNKPSFATVSTSGSYNDLTDKPIIPSAYTLPVATSSVLGGVKQGTGVTISADGTISATGSGGASTGNIELAGFLNVMDNGADNTGATDTTTAIQSILDKALTDGYVNVYIPDGTYKVGKLNFASNTHVVMSDHAKLLRNPSNAEGTENIMLINSNGNTAATVYNGNGNIIIEGGIIDGNYTATDDNTTSYAFQTAAFGHANGLIFRNIKIYNGAKNNHVFDLGGCTNVLFQNIKFYGVHSNSSNGSEAIQIDQENSSSFPHFGSHDGTVTSNVMVDGCYFGKNPNDSSSLMIACIGTHAIAGAGNQPNIKIINNTFENTTGNPIRLMGYENVYIANNTFTNVNQTLYSPISMDTCTRVVIDNNIFPVMTSTSADTNYMFKFSNSTDVEFKNHKIKCMWNIFNPYNSTNVNIFNNTIRDCIRAVSFQGTDINFFDNNIYTENMSGSAYLFEIKGTSSTIRNVSITTAQTGQTLLYFNGTNANVEKLKTTSTNNISGNAVSGTLAFKRCDIPNVGVTFWNATNVYFESNNCSSLGFNGTSTYAFIKNNTIATSLSALSTTTIIDGNSCKTISTSSACTEANITNNKVFLSISTSATNVFVNDNFLDFTGQTANNASAGIIVNAGTLGIISGNRLVNMNATYKPQYFISVASGVAAKTAVVLGTNDIVGATWSGSATIVDNRAA